MQPFKSSDLRKKLSDEDALKAIDRESLRARRKRAKELNAMMAGAAKASKKSVDADIPL